MARCVYICTRNSTLLLDIHLGPCSLRKMTDYRKISWSLGAARINIMIFLSLWKLTDGSTAVLPDHLSNFRAIAELITNISRSWDSARSRDKTSLRLVTGGPGFLLRPGRVSYLSPPEDRTAHGLLVHTSRNRRAWHIGFGCIDVAPHNVSSGII